MEIVVDTFTQVGENLGRLECYRDIFSSNKTVQTTLALIYADIIHFCVQATIFYQKDGLRKN